MRHGLGVQRRDVIECRRVHFRDDLYLVCFLRGSAMLAKCCAPPWRTLFVFTFHRALFNLYFKIIFVNACY